ARRSGRAGVARGAAEAGGPCAKPRAIAVERGEPLGHEAQPESFAGSRGRGSTVSVVRYREPQRTVVAPRGHLQASALGARSNGMSNRVLDQELQDERRNSRRKRLRVRLQPRLETLTQAKLLQAEVVLDESPFFRKRDLVPILALYAQDVSKDVSEFLEGRGRDGRISRDEAHQRVQQVQDEVRIELSAETRELRLSS